MFKFPVIQVEIHLTHSCNLTCDSCGHFSNDGHSGRLTPTTFTENVLPWSDRLLPEYFLLLGGEPLLNPDLLEIIPLARELFPSPVCIILVTNGFLLHRFKKLPEVLAKNKLRLDISIHHNSPEYLDRIKDVMGLVEDSYSPAGIDVRYRDSYKDWTRMYKGGGANIRPYTDNNSQMSWEACVSKDCLQIHEGKLWKCPPLAYLPMQVNKFGIDPNGEWKKYLQYKPCEPDCSGSRLNYFLSKKCEHFCAMCPAEPERFLKSLPLR